MHTVRVPEGLYIGFGASAVQARPFAKSPLQGFTLLRSSFLLIRGRSLDALYYIKIRASTIFM